MHAGKTLIHTQLREGFMLAHSLSIESMMAGVMSAVGTQGNAVSAVRKGGSAQFYSALHPSRERVPPAEKVALPIPVTSSQTWFTVSPRRCQIPPS